MTIGVSIIEDDTAARAVLADWIRQAEGFACLGEYGNAESALAALPAQKPDVVLMDINLPAMSGTECVRRLKPGMPATQFVMLTVYEDTTHIFSALAAGASGYLLKQTPLNDVLAAIREVHAGGSPMSSGIARKVVQFFRQAPPATDETAKLAPREAEVLDLLARGFLYKEIADALHITLRTVNTHIHRIYEKLHVRSRAQAVAKYAQLPQRIPTGGERGAAVLRRG